MTDVRVAIVDVYVLRPAGSGMQALVLRRGPGGRSPGTWETVHGHIQDGETPARAALRELREETGLVPQRFYNVSRVESFYLHRQDLVALIPVFCAIVAEGSREVLSDEHDRAEWLSPADASGRYAWPRERRALADVMDLVGRGDAGGMEDVLRVS